MKELLYTTAKSKFTKVDGSMVWPAKRRRSPGLR